MAIVTAIFLPQPALAQTGDFTLFLTVYRNKIEPGQDNVLFLEVRNTGKTELTNITFSSLAPEGWIIEFEPATIDRLNPDNFQTVKVKVKPPATIKGYDEVTLIAEAHGLRRVARAYLGVEVETDKRDFTLFLSVYRDEVEPGQDNVLFLEVRNTGKTELTNIEFSSLASVPLTGLTLITFRRLKLR
ncbi:MAG: hypothetical protein HYU85_02425 [Chloroflexi bacterium]|nr:hypothetical protein [Chloroflexota bacterium]